MQNMNGVTVQHSEDEWEPNIGERVRVRDTGRLGTVDKLKGVYSLRVHVLLDRPTRVIRSTMRPQRQAWYDPEELDPVGS
jgi:hypothetical protein